MGRYGQQTNTQKSQTPIIATLILIIIFLLWMFFDSQKSNETEIKTIDIPKESIRFDSKTKSTSSDIRTGQRSTPEKPFENKIKLPELEDSDDFFRQEASFVSAGLPSWFRIKNVIKKYIALVNDISQNQLFTRHRAFLKPLGKMRVKRDSQGLYLPKDSYRRYDSLADAITAIDVDKGLQLYLTFKPLFEKVYKEFGYPADYRLEDIFLKAAANVIKAPVIEGRIGLKKHSVKYMYTDKGLESLTGVEKQMLRMGPENTKKIQAKLRKLVQALVVFSE
jgi:hypothetical protein